MNAGQRIFYIFFTTCIPAFGDAVLIAQPAFQGNRTATWEECIAAYRQLDSDYAMASLNVIGSTDVGKPLHLFIINQDKIFYPELFDPGKTVLLINNGIHPGEPDGVDASLLLSRELLDPNSELHQTLDHVIVCIVPVLNVDGALARNGELRVNQNGPEEYGFRGNGRNLDLNRDFVKCDAENVRAFCRMFRSVRPHVLVDTHVSNGADYAYTMTLIATQSDKLGGAMGHYQRNTFAPALFDRMAALGDTMSHYVNTMGRTPESGMVAFMESPRFLSGYAALFNTFAFITETHMLKPYARRVESTLRFLQSMIYYLDEHGETVRDQKRMNELAMLARDEFPLLWELDTLQRGTVHFSGYTAREESALVGTGKRLKYDHNLPFFSPIAHYERYAPATFAKAPDFYILPQAWREVAERLKCNRVLMKNLKADTVLRVVASYIEDYHTAHSPYEGRYPHDHITIRQDTALIQFYKGDWLIDTRQEARRYLVETLEPQGEDSFFAWNFFDAVLQQKEWFSDYVFEEKAAELIASDPALKKEFETAIATDEDLRNSHWQQLYWIYKRSPYAEKSAFRYPVYRLLD